MEEIKLKKKNKVLFLIIVLLGSAYAFFSYSNGSQAFTLTSNGITARFTSGNNHISFENALPLSDEYALSNLESLGYADFTVSGNAEDDDEAITYEIYLTESNNNTLDSRYIKIYLTDENNNEIAGPSIYSSLGNTTYERDASNGKLIFKERVKGEFSKKYRLYVWIDSSFSENAALTFSFYINLYAFNDTSEDIYTVTFDKGNLLYGIIDTNGTVHGRQSAESNNSYADYKISDGIVTVTNTGLNPLEGYTLIEPAKVYLEKEKTYIFNCQTDGTWGGRANDDTVEAFLMLDGLFTAYIRMDNSTINFTPTKTGTYWLRLDVNMTGKEHTFSNISITEADSSKETKQVTYHEDYGNLPVPTREGYTFMGWNGANYYNYQDVCSSDSSCVSNGVTTDDEGWITIDTSTAGTYYNYWTNNLNVLLNNIYMIVAESGDVSNVTGILSIASQNTDNTGQFSDILFNNFESNKNYIYKAHVYKTINVGHGLRTFYKNENLNTNEKLTFRISVLDENDSLNENNFEYEPYYITSTTRVVQNKDHTLKAIWQENE